MTTVNIADMANTAPTLTRQQKTITTLIGAGKTNDDIAKELFVSVNTVKVHIRSIYRRLGLEDGAQNNRVVVALYAIRSGMVEVL
jgi:DNA-binding NarL/FixJ family response regulator